MIDINELEMGVLIEADDFNYPVNNLMNDVTVRGKNLDRDEVYRTACSIIGSLYVQGYITIVRTAYQDEGDDLYTPLATTELAGDELDTFLKHPEKWDDMEVFSKTATVEMKITDRGRDYLMASYDD